MSKDVQVPCSELAPQRIITVGHMVDSGSDSDEIDFDLEMLLIHVVPECDVSFPMKVLNQ